MLQLAFGGGAFQQDQDFVGLDQLALGDPQVRHDAAFEVLHDVDRSGRHDLAVTDRGFLDLGDAGQQDEAADQNGEGDQELAQQAGRAGLLQQQGLGQEAHGTLPAAGLGGVVLFREEQGSIHAAAAFCIFASTASGFPASATMPESSTIKRSARRM